MAKLDPLLTRTKQGKLLTDAIKNLHPISFYYTGPRTRSTLLARRIFWRNPVKTGNRVKAKPVAIGISPRNTLLVRVHIQAPSVSRRGVSYNSGWRTFIIANMNSLKVHTTEKFSLSIPLYNKGGVDKSFKRTLLFITPQSVKENSKSKFELQREKRLQEKQQREFEKMAKQRKAKAKKDLAKKKKSI
jgi:hypothetical protein